MDASGAEPTLDVFGRENGLSGAEKAADEPGEVFQGFSQRRRVEILHGPKHGHVERLEVAGERRQK